MENFDIKTSLKLARNAIKDKDFEMSLRLSKAILREDRNNYLALVFLGLSFQEVGPSSQAPLAFKKAIEIDAKNPLAWNGLLHYYEKTEDLQDSHEIADILYTLLTLESNESKLLEYSGKLIKLTYLNNNPEFLKKVITQMDDLINLEKCKEFTRSLQVNLAKLLSKYIQIPDNFSALFRKTFEQIMEDSDSATADLYSKYLRVLYNEDDMSTLKKYTFQMKSLYESEITPHIWICKLFCEHYTISSESNESLNIVEESYKCLVQSNINLSLVDFTKCVLLIISDNDVFEAYSILNKVVHNEPQYVYPWMLLAVCLRKLHFYTKALNILTKCESLVKLLPTVKQPAFNKFLQNVRIETYSRCSDRSHLDNVLLLYKQCNCISYLPHVIRAHIALENFDKATKLLSEVTEEQDKNLQFKLLRAQLLRKLNKPQEALNILEQTTDSSQLLTSEWWLELGGTFSDLKNFGVQCLTANLKAAKLEPYNYLCFTALGRYYNVTGDFDKARRCFEKAFKLNSESATVGIELCQTYRQLQKWNDNIALLMSLTGGKLINKENSWAWLQLGLHFLQQDQFDKAIENLRLVARIDPENKYCWESLADSYLARGAYTSAKKSYERAAELSSDNIYADLQTANIAKEMGDYVQAKQIFGNILSTNSLYVPALKGFAQTCFLQAREFFDNQRLGTARDYIQLSVNATIDALKQRREFSCLWKLLGDCCLMMTKLPEKFCWLSLPALLFEAKASEQSRFVERDDLFSVAIKCYSRSQTLVEHNLPFWFDLGLCYFYTALHSEKNEEEVQNYYKNALSVAYHCVHKESNNFRYWNFLGVVAAKMKPSNFALAQHAFIKSVTLNNNNALGWSNLGTLYLLCDDVKLANAAFSRAQRVDPNYINSWIGQAMIAEHLFHEDTMDLYRHSTQLGVHKESCLGYARWVCKTLLQSSKEKHFKYSISNMHAVPVACDSLTWYTEMYPYDCCAWNMLGMLQERMTLRQSAVRSFKNSLQLSPLNHKDSIRINYGRALTQLEHYEEALNTLNSVEDATFNSRCTLAIAFFKDAQYELSYEAYEMALNCLTDQHSAQSEVLIALACMSYKFQGADEAKTLLYQSIQLENTSSWSFFAIMALALIDGDDELAHLVAPELSKFEDTFDGAALSAWAKLVNREDNAAICYVSRLIHMVPNKPFLWALLMDVLVRGRPIAGLIAAKCANIARKFAKNSVDTYKILRTEAYGVFISGSQKQALSAAQKLIHHYPKSGEGWVLIGILKLYDNAYKSQVLKIFNMVLSLDLTQQLRSWVEQCLISIQ